MAVYATVIFEQQLASRQKGEIDPKQPDNYELQTPKIIAGTDNPMGYETFGFSFPHRRKFRCHAAAMLTP